MRVTCHTNDLLKITESEVRERVRQFINIDGPITALTLGRGYDVQAIEKRGGGLFFYLHTVEEADHPYPYPAELFDAQDSAFPAGWGVSLRKERGFTDWRRISFAEWAESDDFYERLVEGDPLTVAAYRRSRVRSHGHSGG